MKKKDKLAEIKKRSKRKIRILIIILILIFFLISLLLWGYTRDITKKETGYVNIFIIGDKNKDNSGKSKYDFWGKAKNDFIREQKKKEADKKAIIKIINLMKEQAIITQINQSQSQQ